MELQHLPPALVPYINALSHKASDHRDDLEDFLEGLNQMERWLEFEQGYTIDDAEALLFENLATLLSEARVSTQLPDKQAQLDRLVPTVFQATQLMDQVHQRRGAPHYSAQPAVNDFLICGAALLQGRASPLALQQRWERLSAYTSVLRQAFRGARSRLRPEVVEALEHGFNYLRQGLGEVESAWTGSGTPESLQDALAMVKDGADIMQHLIDWQRQDQQRLAEQQVGYRIPEIGPALGLAVEQARELPREQWTRGIRHIREELIPRFQDSWVLIQQRVFVNPMVRDSLLAQVEEDLEGFQLALDDMLDPQVERGAALGAVESSLEQLSATIEECQRETLPHHHLAGTQAGQYIEALLGALQGTLPFVAFPELFHSSPPPEEWKPIVDLMLAYGDDLDPAHLYRAGYLLLQRFPLQPQPDEHPQSWTCACCGQPNPLGQQRCGRCGGKGWAQQP